MHPFSQKKLSHTCLRELFLQPGLGPRKTCALKNLDPKITIPEKPALREKCPYSESFWFAFFLIRIEHGEILRVSPYSVRMRENTDQNNSEYGHFSRRGSQEH